MLAGSPHPKSGPPDVPLPLTCGEQFAESALTSWLRPSRVVSVRMRLRLRCVRRALWASSVSGEVSPLSSSAVCFLFGVLSAALQPGCAVCLEGAQARAALCNGLSVAPSVGRFDSGPSTVLRALWRRHPSGLLLFSRWLHCPALAPGNRGLLCVAGCRPFHVRPF